MTYELPTTEDGRMDTDAVIEYLQGDLDWRDFLDCITAIQAHTSLIEVEAMNELSDGWRRANEKVQDLSDTLEQIRKAGQSVLDNACVSGDTLADVHRLVLDALDVALNKTPEKAPYVAAKWRDCERMEIRKMKKFSGFKSVSKIEAECKERGFTIITDKYDNGGDWVTITGTFGDEQLTFVYSGFNGRFIGKIDDMIYSERNTNLEGTNWYDAILNFLYIPPDASAAEAQEGQN